MMKLAVAVALLVTIMTMIASRASLTFHRSVFKIEKEYVFRLSAPPYPRVPPASHLRFAFSHLRV
jgi:hypothetical protein